MKILILDNYDSFTYNLAQMCDQITGKEVTVLKNDGITLSEADQFDKIILSPGPGIPSEAGIMPQLIRNFAGTKPIFGVCLGLQAIVEAFGGKIFNLNQVFHGVATEARQTADHYIFNGLPSRLPVGRYHSWAADSESIPDDLVVTSVDPEGTIMSIKHKTFDLHGVQYHPESILTPLGKTILKNFLLH